MKKLAMGVLSVLMVACFAAAAIAQSNPRGTSSVTLGGKMFPSSTDGPRSKGAPRMRCSAG